MLTELKKYEEAIASIEKVIELNETAEAWNGKGRIYTLSQDYEKAIIAFEKAIKINPKYALAWYNKGEALDLGGESKQTCFSYQEVKRIEPNYPQIDLTINLVCR